MVSRIRLVESFFLCKFISLMKKYLLPSFGMDRYSLMCANNIVSVYRISRIIYGASTVSL